MRDEIAVIRRIRRGIEVFGGRYTFETFASGVVAIKRDVLILRNRIAAEDDLGAI